MVGTDGARLDIPNHLFSDLRLDELDDLKPIRNVIQQPSDLNGNDDIH